MAPTSSGRPAAVPEIRLEAMSREQLDETMAGLMADYIQHRLEAGETEAEAEEAGRLSNELYFPGGHPAPGHRHYSIIRHDEQVGHLWIGPSPNGTEDVHWIFFIGVDEGHRGEGLGRAAMLAAEVEAREHGARELGLNVFGPNSTARNLYRSLGYSELAVVMRKQLGPALDTGPPA